MASTITVTDNSNRAGRIAIGVIVIAFIIYWRVTGTIPSLLSGVMPEPPDGKVAGVYDFATNMLADLLAFTGSIVVAVFTTIGALILQVISWLIGKVTKPAVVESKPDSPDVKTMFAYLAANVATKQEMADVCSRVYDLEKSAAIVGSVAPAAESVPEVKPVVTRSKTSTRGRRVGA